MELRGKIPQVCVCGEFIWMSALLGIKFLDHIFFPGGFYRHWHFFKEKTEARLAFLSGGIWGSCSFLGSFCSFWSLVILIKIFVISCSGLFSSGHWENLMEHLFLDSGCASLVREVGWWWWKWRRQPPALRGPWHLGCVCDTSLRWSAGASLWRKEGGEEGRKERRTQQSWEWVKKK
jgi:hypothetical protein